MIGFTLGFLLVVGAGVVGFAIGTYIAKKAGLYDGLAITSAATKRRMKRYFDCIQNQLDARGFTWDDWFPIPDEPQRISPDVRNEIESTCELAAQQRSPV